MDCSFQKIFLGSCCLPFAAHVFTHAIYFYVEAERSDLGATGENDGA